MINKVLKAAVNTVIDVLSWIYYSLFGNKHSKNVLIVAPSWEGSLGDEAVLDSISHALQAKGFLVTLIHWGKANEWSNLKAVHSKISLPYYFKENIWKDRLRFIIRFRHYSRFYLLGTDMLDGCYAEWLTLGLLRLTRQAAMAGLKTTLVGFSINTWQRPSCIRMLKKMPSGTRLCVRDDVSLKRLANLTGRADLLLTADMAFLLSPTPSRPFASSAIAWIQQQKSKGNIVVGLNINPQLFEKLEHPLDVFIKAIGNAVKSASLQFNKKLSLFLLPHDFRDYNSDVVLLDQLLNELPDHLKENSFIIRQKPHASEIKAIAGELDIVLTGRMHVAIACLGQTTPLGCIVYQGKFEGLFNHFQLDDKYKIEPLITANENRITDFIVKLINERDTIKERIKSRISEVKQMSDRNID